MVRKSELQDATWDEVDFENAVWSIPKERMKWSKAHNVYLTEQAVDIFIALKTCASNSRYVLPSRYDADAPMSRATFNRITTAVVVRAKIGGLDIGGRGLSHMIDFSSHFESQSPDARLFRPCEHYEHDLTESVNLINRLRRAQTV